MAITRTEWEEGVATVEREATETPRRFHVLLHNDNYTTMDCVVEILESIFHHPHPAAVQIMLQVHRNGAGIAGTYPKDIAETLRDEARAFARERGYPLLLTVEPE